MRHETTFLTYEDQLNQDPHWALREGSMHFEKESAVHQTLTRIVGRLNGLGIDYAIAGGMALFFHGYRRFTEDVDILVTADGLRVIHERLSGLGYLPPFEGSKNLRDTASGVRVEFLIAGQYPGDGKPKPVSFPVPATVAIEVDGVRCLALPALVELKLASGSAPGRFKDLGDVQELIRVLNLTAEFGDGLDSSVRPLYRELWEGVRDGPPDQDQT